MKVWPVSHLERDAFAEKTVKTFEIFTESIFKKRPHPGFQGIQQFVCCSGSGPLGTCFHPGMQPSPLALKQRMAVGVAQMHFAGGSRKIFADLLVGRRACRVV